MKFKFLDAFPPPQFINIPYAGLSISDTAVRCVQFVKRTDHLDLVKYAEKPIPLGAVLSGCINNAEEITQILTDLKKEVKINRVKVSLPEEKAYLFTTQIPIVGKDELRSAIEFKLEENVPLSAQEIVFDYAVVSSADNADHLDVVVSALPVSVVDVYVDTVRNAGLSLLSLEIESQAVIRALLPKRSKGSYLVIQFGHEKAGLYIVRDNIIHFTSTVNTKGESMENPTFLVQEINKLLKYWNNQAETRDYPNRQVDQVLLCGDNFNHDLVSFVSSHTTVPTALGNVWTNVCDINTTVPQIPFDESLRYASAIGLAIPMGILM
jgi:Tfp pilus assembly PilM family ATPase